MVFSVGRASERCRNEFEDLSYGLCWGFDQFDKLRGWFKSSATTTMLSSGLWILSLVGSLLSFGGYVPELYRLLCAPLQQPASQLLWTLWIIAAILNVSYAAVSGSDVLVVINYSVHTVMTTLGFFCNARLVIIMRRQQVMRLAVIVASNERERARESQPSSV